MPLGPLPLQQFGFINKEHQDAVLTMKYHLEPSPVVWYLLVVCEPSANAFQLSVTDLPEFILGHGGHSTAQGYKSSTVPYKLIVFCSKGL